MEEITHSKLNVTSYGFGKFVNEFFVMAFGSIVFFFYETEIGLPSYLTMTGYIIFAVWNAVNDPLVGYLTDRPFKFTKKWGRRFPWVFIGGVPWVLSYFLIFIPPAVDPNEGAWIIFGWLVLSTCLYDTFASVFAINFYSIFPDKFRAASERRSASTISTVIGALGTAAGAIVPPLIYEFENPQSYALQAIVVVMVCLIALLIAIPGTREDQLHIDCYLDNCEKETERTPFFSELKSILKHKNFMAYIVTFTLYQSLVSLMTGSVPYIAQFLLQVEEDEITLIMAALILGIIFSMPLWSRLANRTNNDRKTMLIATIYLTITTLILFFIDNYWIMLVAIFVWGTGEGGFWVMMSPIFADIIDESIIDTKKRKEGIYNGFQTFVSRAALVIQAVSFSVVHMLTGFDQSPGATSQTGLAIFGIQIHFALIPAILILIGAIVFWKFYKLTPDIVDRNRQIILEEKL